MYTTQVHVYKCAGVCTCDGRFVNWNFKLILQRLLASLLYLNDLLLSNGLLTRRRNTAAIADRITWFCKLVQIACTHKLPEYL